MGLFDGGDGGVSDISDVYTPANGGAPIVAGDSPYTFTESDSIFAEVDTTAGAVTVDPTSLTPSDGDRLVIFDAGGNAGTNIITITGLGTIESDGGKKEFRYDGAAWKLLDVSQVHFTRDASAGEVTLAGTDRLRADSLGTKAANVTIDNLGNVVATTGSFGQQADVETTEYAEFQNADINIDADGTSYGNLFIADSTPFNDGNYNTDATTPYTVTDNGNAGASFEGWKLFDGDTGSRWAKSGLPGIVTIDTSTPRTIVSYRIHNYTAAGNNPVDWTLEGSPNGSSWTVVDTVVGHVHGAGWSNLFTVDNPGSYQYYRINITDDGGNNFPTFFELDLREGSFATTLNTIETEDVASGTFAPASFEFRDEADIPITAAGNLEVEWTEDGGSSWSTKEDANAFLARTTNIISAGIFRLRLTPIGAQRIKQVDVSGTSVIMSASAAAWQYVVNGTAVASISPQGVADMKTTGLSVSTEGTALTADTLLNNEDYIVELDASGGAFTMTLPAVGTVKTGKRYLFKKVDVSANAITLDGDSAETIDGATTNATALAAQWDLVEIYNNGSEWLIINEGP
jgi:hypothetical protein